MKIITFCLYSDALARHIYESNNITYELITFFPESMYKDVLKAVKKYEYVFEMTDRLKLLILDSMPIRKSAFAKDYGVIEWSV